MTDDEILKRAEEIKEARSRVMQSEAEAVQARAKMLGKRGPTEQYPGFTEEELRYSAAARCKCGAGYAYPKKCGGGGQWDCSALLKGEAAHGSSHSASLPFMFYEVKSEEQPSAYGTTTRPKAN